MDLLNACKTNIMTKEFEDNILITEVESIDNGAYLIGVINLVQNKRAKIETESNLVDFLIKEYPPQMEEVFKNQKLNILDTNLFTIVLKQYLYKLQCVDAKSQ